MLASSLTFAALHPDLIDGVASLNGTANHLEYEQFQDAIAAVDSKWLRSVLDDLTPRDGNPAALQDSRDVTTYGYVIENPKAYKLLRQTGDLRVAEQLVQTVALTAKIEGITRRVVALITEAEEVEEQPEAFDAARNLHAKTKQLMNALREEEA